LFVIAADLNDSEMHGSLLHETGLADCPAATLELVAPFPAKS
jgi:hypothetical protein